MGTKQLNQTQVDMGREMFGAELFDDIVSKAEEQTARLEKETNFKEVDEVKTPDTETVESINEESTEQSEVTEDINDDVAPVIEDVDPEVLVDEAITEPIESEDEIVVNEAETETPEPVEKEVDIQEIVKQVTEELTAGLKDELGVIAVIPEALEQLGKRVAQLEKQAKIKQASENSRFSLFSQYKAASVTDASDNVVDENIAKSAGPTSTQGVKSAADHFFNS